MKRIFSTVVIFLCSYSIFGQAHRPVVIESIYDHFTGQVEINKVNSLSLIGPVKRIIISAIDSLLPNSLHFIETFTFNINNMLSEYEFVIEGAEETKNTKHFEYDVNGKLIRINEKRIRYGETRIPAAYHFNPSGFLDRITTDSVYQRALVSYKYVETDNRTVITKSPSSDYDIDGNSEGDSLAFTLNQLDQCTSTSQYHFFGEKKTTMTYTMEGLLSVFSSGLKSNGHSSSHSYDEQKRLISQHNSWHGINQIGNYVGYESTKYTYDSTGLINSIEINKNIDDREIYPTRLHSGPSDERNNRAERAPEIRTLKYTFDEIGNWIECEHYSLAGELVFKEKREIEYF